MSTFSAGLLQAGAPVAVSKDSLEVRFVTDHKVDDGRFANNGWLQECPDPITKISWDNAILISPRLAKEIGVYPHGSALQVARVENAEYTQGKELAHVAEIEVNGRKVRGGSPWWEESLTVPATPAPEPGSFTAYWTFIRPLTLSASASSRASVPTACGTARSSCSTTRRARTRGRRCSAPRASRAGRCAARTSGCACCRARGASSWCPRATRSRRSSTR